MIKNIFRLEYDKKNLLSLKNYQNADFITQMTAHFIYKVSIVMTIILGLLTVSTIIIQALFYDGVKPFIVLVEIIGLGLLVNSIYILLKGELNKAIHYILILCFSAIWLIMFINEEPIIPRLNSIALAFGVLAMTALLTHNKAKYLVLYTISNLIILAVYSYFIKLTTNIDLGDILDYFIDNTLSFILIAIVSYNLSIIYLKFIERSENALAKVRKSEEEVRLLNEDLEEKVKLRTAELNNALNVIEESNTELQILNEGIASESQKLLILNEKLLISEQKLTIANETKDKFFSIVSHDLKNPLSALITGTDLLFNYYDRFNDEDRIIKIRKISESSKFLFKLLDNLLQWSRSQTNSIEFNCTKNDLVCVINSNIELLKLNAESKNILIKYTGNNYIESNFDVEMINTVIRNLISNAIKFTPEGGTVEIGTIILEEKTSDVYAENKINIYVKDSGVGMSEETINKLFRIDVNITTEGTNKEKGTGLGLILCKEFVEKHKGKIWVESEVGKGSTFWFSLPNQHKI